MLTGYGIAGSVAACLTLRLIEEGGEQFLSRIRCISFGQVMIDSAAFNVPSLPFTPSCPSKMSDQNWARGSEGLSTWRRRGFSSELPRATRSRRNLGYFSSQSAVLVELRRCNPKGKKTCNAPPEFDLEVVANDVIQIIKDLRLSPRGVSRVHVTRGSSGRKPLRRLGPK